MMKPFALPKPGLSSAPSFLTIKGQQRVVLGTCDYCHKEVVNIMFECMHCPFVVLCVECEAKGVHDAKHVLLIKI